LSSFDTLTGCYNRRYFVEFLERELLRAGRAGTATGVVLIDVDRFDAISEQHGNIAADDVLCELARRIRARVRRDDMVARYGGDQFTFVLANADLDGARQFAEEVRELIAAQPFACARSEVQITVSAGAAVANPEDATDADALVELAEKALAGARDAGGNRVGAE